MLRLKYVLENSDGFLFSKSIVKVQVQLFEGCETHMPRDSIIN